MFDIKLLLSVLLCHRSLAFGFKFSIANCVTAKFQMFSRFRRKTCSFRFPVIRGIGNYHRYALGNWYSSFAVEISEICRRARSFLEVHRNVTKTNDKMMFPILQR